MEHIYLSGAEQVATAGYAMRSAAGDIQQSAGSLEESFRQHRIFMENWLMDFERILVANKI